MPTRRNPAPPGPRRRGSRSPGRCRRRRSSCWSWDSARPPCPSRPCGRSRPGWGRCSGPPTSAPTPTRRPRTARWAGSRGSRGRRRPRRDPRPGACAAARRGAPPARLCGASGRGSPRTVSTAPARCAPSLPASGRGARRPQPRTRPGSCRRPAPPSRVAGRRPSGTATSIPGSGGSASRGPAPPRSPRPAGRRRRPGARRGDRWTLCSRRSPARPVRPTQRRTPPPRRAAPSAGRGW